MQAFTCLRTAHFSGLSLLYQPGRNQDAKIRPTILTQQMELIFKTGYPVGVIQKKLVQYFFGWLSVCGCFPSGRHILRFLLAFWTASLGLLIYYWRTGRLNASRDPSFIPPRINDDDDTYDEESTHTSIRPPRSTSTVVPVAEDDVYDSSNQANSPFADPHRHSSMTAYSGYPTTTSSVPPPGRPSLDAYGAFSDPAPSGFVNPSGFSTGPTQSSPPSLPIPDLGPRVSRTMQYADPYAAVRASITEQASPPSYESYSGYR